MTKKRLVLLDKDGHVIAIGTGMIGAYIANVVQEGGSAYWTDLDETPLFGKRVELRAWVRLEVRDD